MALFVDILPALFSFMHRRQKKAEKDLTCGMDFLCITFGIYLHTYLFLTCTT